jgi:hypothetical protein
MEGQEESEGDTGTSRPKGPVLLRELSTKCVGSVADGSKGIANGRPTGSLAKLTPLNG